MTEETFAEPVLRPFPEPEWLPPPDDSGWVWLVALSAAAGLMAFLVSWYRRKYLVVDKAAWSALQTLLTLRSELEVLQEKMKRTGRHPLNYAESDNVTLLRILDQAYAIMREGWQKQLEIESRVTVPGCSRYTPVGELSQILTELEKARFCGRLPEARWVAFQLEQAAACFARLVCSVKNWY